MSARTRKLLWVAIEAVTPLLVGAVVGLLVRDMLWAFVAAMWVHPIVHMVCDRLARSGAPS
jgi:hypothetical protein